LLPAALFFCNSRREEGDSKRIRRETMPASKQVNQRFAAVRWA
jgi:hypothetical protein